MSEWQIRYGDRGETAAVYLEGDHPDELDLVALVRQARADRDAQFIAWIEEEWRDSVDSGVGGTLALERLRARLEGK